MSRSSSHQQSVGSLILGLALFFGGAAVLLFFVFVADIGANRSPGLATRLVADMWPFLVIPSAAMGMWVLGVFLAGPVVIDEKGITNPYSFMRGRRIPWHTVNRIRLVRVSGSQVGTVYFDLDGQRRKILRLGIFRDPEAIIDRISEMAPCPIEIVR